MKVSGINKKYKKKKARGGKYIVPVVVMVIAYLVFYFSSAGIDRKNEIGDTLRQSSPTEKRQINNSEVSPVPEVDGHDMPNLLIKSITLTPKYPTVLDDIKAEVSSNYNDRIVYEYKWMVNDKFIDEIKGNTLPAGLFKKKDDVSVVVTPHMGDIRGQAFISVPVIIHSAPPSLELKETSQKLNEAIELQLISMDPDGDRVTFSLEEPLLEGMSIDKETGKITWKPAKIQKGTYKFGALATDIDGAKTIKTFTFSIHDK